MFSTLSPPLHSTLHPLLLRQGHPAHRHHLCWPHHPPHHLRSHYPCPCHLPEAEVSYDWRSLPFSDQDLIGQNYFPCIVIDILEKQLVSIFPFSSWSKSDLIFQAWRRRNPIQIWRFHLLPRGWWGVRKLVHISLLWLLLPLINSFVFWLYFFQKASQLLLWQSLHFHSFPQTNAKAYVLLNILPALEPPKARVEAGLPLLRWPCGDQCTLVTIVYLCIPCI